MLILKTIWLSVWLILLPVCIGGNFNKKEDTRLIEWLKTYIYGFLFELGSFELVTLPLTFMKKSLTLVMVIWGSVNVLFGICGFLRQGKDIASVGRDMVSRRKGFIPDFTVMGWISIILIAFQAIYVAAGMHIDMDDAWYVGTAMSSYATDTLNLISADTGDETFRFAGDYVMAPFPVFWAMMGRITDIHPAIIMHTLLPLFFIPLSYGVYYLIAEKLYHGKRKRMVLFMVFLCLFSLFGNFSSRSLATFLMFRIWQGKSLLCNIVLPIMTYMFLCMVEEKKNIYWLGLFMAVLAGTMVSSMGVFLGPVLLAVLAMVDLFMKRRWKNCIKAFVCVMPCIGQFVIYMFYLR